MDGDYFAQLVAAVRTGDGAAAEELLREVEPYLRRVIRIRLAKQQVRHVVDTGDIFQTVMKDFFQALGQGRYTFGSQEDLHKLLTTMALNRVIAKARKEKRHPLPLPADRDLPEKPSEVADMLVNAEEQRHRAELVARVLEQLGERDAQLLDQKYRLGRSWDEVARTAGESSAAVRMRLMRGLRRAYRELAERSSCPRQILTTPDKLLPLLLMSSARC